MRVGAQEKKRPLCVRVGCPAFIRMENGDVCCEAARTAEDRTQGRMAWVVPPSTKCTRMAEQGKVIEENIVA
jgi:hypothetical protein